MESEMSQAALPEKQPDEPFLSDIKTLRERARHRPLSGIDPLLRRQ
jgi:hypothetical protein